MGRAKFLTLFLNLCFIFLIMFLTAHLYSSNFDFFNYPKRPNSLSYYHQTLASDVGCGGLPKYQDSQAKCSYVKSQRACHTGGYISYLQLFYCHFTPIQGYTILILWLILLFYLLGDTAANYFCSSLEGLSETLNLSPTIAGVTLLSLGNGAPDLFASMASFMEDSTNLVGLNSILGGAFFVSSPVVGIISLCISHSHVSIDRSSFIRDVLFLIFSLLSLVLILIFGKINLWVSISFLSLYCVYVFLVSSSELCSKEKGKEVPKLLLEESSDLEAPLLLDEPKVRKCCGVNIDSSVCCFLGKLMFILELPLYLPRRLTIPVVSEERWSRFYGVISVTIAPILFALIWKSKGPSLLKCLVGGSVGTCLGFLAFSTTNGSNPPRKGLCFWLLGGFLMSITWTYIVAQELVSLLVSLGIVLGINPSILGVTVLAWGNSLGDLVTNVTMARNGGPDGVQVAISGCYAGPIFNTVVGLGLSLSLQPWAVYPSFYLMPKDPSVYETLGFLVGGLLWALVVLPKNSMRLDRFLGFGLLAIYLCFLSLKMATILGLL